MLRCYEATTASGALPLEGPPAHASEWSKIGSPESHWWWHDNVIGGAILTFNWGSTVGLVKSG